MTLPAPLYLIETWDADSNDKSTPQAICTTYEAALAYIARTWPGAQPNTDDGQDCWYVPRQGFEIVLTLVPVVAA